MPLVTCSDCGKQHSDAAQACPNCGRPNAEVRGAASALAHPPQPPKKSSSSSLAGCLVLILLGVFLWHLGQSSGDRPTGGSPVRGVVPAPPPSPSGPSLEIESWRWSTAHGYAKAEGQVRNISGKSLENVTAVVTFYDKDGKFITSADSLIDYNPILSGQVSPFSVLARYNPAMGKATLEFKYLMGGTIPSRKK